MRNVKQKIFVTVAAVLLVAGIVLGTLGVIGTNIYNEAAIQLGCKKPDAIGYIQDPSTITAVATTLSAERHERFLTGSLDLDAAAVAPAVEAHVAYNEALASTQDITSVLAFISEKESVDNEGAKEFYMDEEYLAAAKQEMMASALNCSVEELESKADDSALIALYQEGFTALYNGSAKKSNLFNYAVTYLFLGIICFIAGFAFFFIRAMDDSKKVKRAGVKKRAENPKAKKFGEFLLNYALYIILITILIVVCIVKPNFLNINNILNILKQASTKGILALGCAGLIVLAGTDLSIGRVLGLSAAVTASLVQATDYASRMFPQMTTQLPLFIPLLASIAVAVLFTLFNGFGVAKLHLHAFIITLGTQLIAQGLCCIYIESQPSGTAQALSTFDRNFLQAAAGNISIGSTRIPVVVLYFIGIAAIMWVVWNKTRLGKNMFAVGGNEEAAAVSGVNVAKTIMLVYLIAGILYGTSAFLEAARITSVGANTGINYETDAISACVVGGVSFSGGVGTIPGVVIGAIILQAINYSLQFLGVNPYLQYVIRGLIIVLAVSIDVRKYIAKK